MTATEVPVANTASFRRGTVVSWGEPPLSSWLVLSTENNTLTVVKFTWWRRVLRWCGWYR